MKKTSKSLVGIAALAVGLSLGPSVSTAQAREFRGPRAAFSGRFRAPLPRGRAFAPRFARGPVFAGRVGFRGPFVGPVIRPAFRPFRTVRVFVYYPFPHWVYRSVYDPYGYPY